MMVCIFLRNVLGIQENYFFINMIVSIVNSFHNSRNSMNISRSLDTTGKYVACYHSDGMSLRSQSDYEIVENMIVCNSKRIVENFETNERENDSSRKNS